MTHSVFYVRAFKRNCPNIRMTKDESEELERLFRLYGNEAREAALAATDQPQGEQDG